MTIMPTKVPASTKFPKAVKAADLVNVEIPEIHEHTMALTVVGDAPLIIHRFSEKAKAQIRDKKETGIKPPKDRVDEAARQERFMAAKYLDPATGREGISIFSFMNAIVDVASGVGLPKTQMKKAFRVERDFIDADGTPCVVIQGKSDLLEAPTKLNDINGTVDLRYRPIYRVWSVRLRLTYYRHATTPLQLTRLLQHAGIAGVGEWRPSSPKGVGEYGRFHIETDSTGGQQ